MASSSVFQDIPLATFGFVVCFQARMQLHHCKLERWGAVGMLAYGTGTCAQIVGGAIEGCSEAAVLCHDSATVKARALKCSGNPVTFMATSSGSIRLSHCTSEDPTPYTAHDNGQLLREHCNFG